MRLFETRRLQRGEAPATMTECDRLDAHLREREQRIACLVDQARAADQRYRTLFDNASEGIVLSTLDGTVIECNRKAAEYIGATPEALAGRHLRAFAPPGLGEAMFDDYTADVARGGGSRSAAVQRDDGRIIHISTTSSVVPLDDQQVVLTIVRDITSQLDTAQRLDAAEERFRALVLRLPDVVWSCDASGMMTFITPNVVPLFGYPIESILGRPVASRFETVHPDDRDMLATHFEAYLRDARPFDIEYRRRHGDGHWIWIRNRTTGHFVRDGVRYMEGLITDITEKKHLELSLRQAQKMEAIGQLTGGIAHDFNNLLASILANSHFLLEDLDEADPRRHDAEQIKVAADRAAALTRQLLAFSRRQVLTLEPVVLDEVMRGLERMLRRLIGEDIRFTVVSSPRLGVVRVDVGQIEQVVMNMVVNARDAMPGGGDLVIETRNVELVGAQAANVGASGPFVAFSVSDTGTGMDSETRRHIFEPFFTTKEVGKGTGLGLSTCYGIVRQCGGHIAVQSEPGVGTTFTVYLPRVDAPARSPAAPKSAPAAGGNETILLIEDEDRVREALGRILRPRGYRVLAARGADDALAMVEAEGDAIDLVLSDVVMPRTNGPELVDTIRARCPRVRVLFISGYTDHAALESAVRERGTRFLQKPFAPEALAGQVREILDGVAD